jgi:AraC-like DNA-binding protein
MIRKTNQRSNKVEAYPKIYLYRRIVQAKLFIDNHFDDCIELENIASSASFSRFHFIRLFKNIYRKTPHQYLTSVRIEKAKEFLSDGIPVSGVCYAVGFDSVTSFTTLFKRATGITPFSFQQQALTRKAAIAAAPLKFIPDCFAKNYGWTKNSNIQ